jgi:two-component system LytT family response regulator
VARAMSAMTGRIVVRREGRAAFVQPDEINWVEAERNYARLYLEEGSHTIRETMKDIEERLGEQFVRIHRCHAVNVTRIREIRACRGGDCEVVLQDGTGLKVGARFRARLEQRLQRGGTNVSEHQEGPERLVPPSSETSLVFGT